MSDELAAWVRSLTVNITAQEKLILGNLAERYNRKTNRCNPSMDIIATEGLVTKPAAFRTVKRLAAKGLLIIHSGGKGPGDRNRYSFPAKITRQQLNLWADEDNPMVTLKPGEKGNPPASKRVTPQPNKGNPPSFYEREERELKRSIPYGGLDAPAAYRQALADLPKNGNKQGQVAVLVNFTRAHCPALANPGRLAAFVRGNEARDVLHAIWQAAGNAKANPLDYVYGTLRRKHRPTSPARRV